MSFSPSSASDTAPTLDLALSLTRDDLKRVDALILERVSREIPLIRDITQHIVASGGKRLRPLLTLLCAQACGYAGGRHIALAASVEFIHTATLLHDDVVDESALRRGLPTANDAFGNKASILVGDFLLAQAFQLMVADGNLRVLHILSDAAAVISQGEVKQLMTEGEPETSEAVYLDVIRCKTAELFAAACELGPVVADQPAQAEPFRAYGMAVGTAFQLVDDALDYASSAEALGKTVGDDFREGKITYPVLCAYRAGTAEERAFWQRTMGEREQREGDLKEAIRLLAKHRAIAQTFDKALIYCDEARRHLHPAPPSPSRQALLEVVDFCASRTH
jgi:octaprenyl-diphosphate synthase